VLHGILVLGRLAVVGRRYSYLLQLQTQFLIYYAYFFKIFTWKIIFIFLRLEALPDSGLLVGAGLNFGSGLGGLLAAGPVIFSEGINIGGNVFVSGFFLDGALEC
jgi:hypothetical protein